MQKDQNNEAKIDYKFKVNDQVIHYNRSKRIYSKVPISYADGRPTVPGYYFWNETNVVNASPETEIEPYTVARFTDNLKAQTL
jgi:hypothetical protein